MSKSPVLSSSSVAVERYGAGPSLLGLAAVLFVVTRVIVWLPLGFVGSWINGLLWPVIVLAAIAGAVITWRRSR